MPAPAADPSRRHRLRLAAEAQVAAVAPVPPLTLEELRRLADRALSAAGEGAELGDLATVLVSNAVWWPQVAAVPYSRRVLLLPQCLRDRARCPAELDEVGLLCEECGGCVTGRLQATAEALGYVVLVAEGTTVVTSLIDSGQVDCVVGVSCLSTLERSFPHTTAAAVPALALPLLSDGCERTTVDVAWVLEAIRARSEASPPQPVELNSLRREVGSWFERGELQQLLDLRGSDCEQVAVEWMGSGGKRWRPYLAAAVLRTMRPEAPSNVVRRLAVAVECFHKASLAHDDIEDDDDERYGVPSLHRRHGMPVALNAGDLLVGEGYRLLADAELGCELVRGLVQVAAHGHRELCVGQGAELAWERTPTVLGVAETLDIFRLKTAPAFRVALALGARAGGADEASCAVLGELSDALGTAYQIRDDIEDFAGDGGDLDSRRPSLMVALAATALESAARTRLGELLADGDWASCRLMIAGSAPLGELEDQAWALYESHRQLAVSSLSPLTHAPLKALLFRIVHKVLAPAPRAAILPHRNGRPPERRPLPVLEGPAGDGEHPELSHVV